MKALFIRKVKYRYKKTLNLFFLLIIALFLPIFVFSEPGAFKEGDLVSRSYNKNNPQDIFQELSSAVVYISTKTVDGRDGKGSGFIVDDHGIYIS